MSTNVWVVFTEVMTIRFYQITVYVIQLYIGNRDYQIKLTQWRRSTSTHHLCEGIWLYDLHKHLFIFGTLRRTVLLRVLETGTLVKFTVQCKMPEILSRSQTNLRWWVTTWTSAVRTGNRVSIRMQLKVENGCLWGRIQSNRSTGLHSGINKLFLWIQQVLQLSNWPQW